MARRQKRAKRAALWATDSEWDAIRLAAEVAGLGVSPYMRAVALGAPTPPRIDADRLAALMHAVADLSRLGNLLKLALQSGPAPYDRQAIQALIASIQATHDLYRATALELAPQR